jgi:hypothetical protein
MIATIWHQGKHERKELGQKEISVEEILRNGPEPHRPFTCFPNISFIPELTISSGYSHDFHQPGRAGTLSFSLQVLPTGGLDGDIQQGSITDPVNSISSLKDPAGTQIVSNIVNAGSNLDRTVQTIYHDAQSLSDYFQPLATSVEYVDKLVKILDSASEVSKLVSLKSR